MTYVRSIASIAALTSAALTTSTWAATDEPHAAGPCDDVGGQP